MRRRCLNIVGNQPKDECLGKSSGKLTNEYPNIIEALDHIQEEARDSKLSDAFWEECKESIDYLTERLGLTRRQVVIVAILCEVGESMSWRQLGKFLGLSRLKTMTLTPDIENLRDKRWIYQCGAQEMNGCFQGFKLVYGIITAFRHNQPFVPEKIEGLSLQAFVDRLVKYVRKECRDGNISTEENHRWMLQLTEANTHLALCDIIMNLVEDSSRLLLLMAVADYARFAGKENEGLRLTDIAAWLEDEDDFDEMTIALQDGSQELIRLGYLSHACQNGMVDTELFQLTEKGKEKLLSGYKIHFRKERILNAKDRNLLKHTEIKAKTLYYNEAEQNQIERLKVLMHKKGLKDVQKRLNACGMRKGIACLFYGSPGTGKTESVFQLARETGRDIFQVDIAGLRDKWVGESEKNIKRVFDNYRRLCNASRNIPILFINEADAIINQRLENTNNSVEKMDNAMQNIILQELENLDGIVIATTNLTGCLDKAFDRRFLFKVEFSKPGIEAKKAIWHDMLPEMSEEACMELAGAFDFSGGQIENIARKCKIEYVVSGMIPSMQLVKEFCKEEYLNRNNMKKVGF
ncbi:MAG: ATP-binding protein [Muribaculaceae bacterium]|nr:ATP-binding protein [Muribaculaceae bacterium]